MKKAIRLSALLFIAFGLSCTASPAENGELDKYTAAVWKSPDGGTLNYRHRAPDKVEKDKKYPLILFLHGAGGRGNDNKDQITDAGTIDAIAKAGLFSKYPCYLIAGQVPRGDRWVNVHWGTNEHKMPEVTPSMRMMLEATDAMIKDERNQIDPKRVYVMGLSMGGYGTWDAIQRRPDFFAAAVPICGGGDKTMGAALAKLPIWAWHGESDRVIRPERSRQMIQAIRAAGGTPKYTEIKGRGHNVWIDAYASEDLWKWLFEQKN